MAEGKKGVRKGEGEGKKLVIELMRELTQGQMEGTDREE